jgi:hypothetical protein
LFRHFSDFFLGGATVLHAIAAFGNELVSVYFRMRDLPRQSRAANAPVPIQPLNCDLQRAVQSAFKAAGQRVETHWKKASEQVVAIVQMPASPCAAASPEVTAARNAANTIQRHLSTGAKPFAFFAIMHCNYA